MTIRREPVDQTTAVTPVPLWRPGDRVRVLGGEHAGRTGTVRMVPSDPLARYVQLEIPNVQVALDGEPGQVATKPGEVARGGRGGVAIILHCDDLEAYDGLPGVAVGARKEGAQ